MSTNPNFLTRLRDKYSDMANSVSQAIVSHTPNYDSMPAPIQQDVKTMVNAGLGVYGIPVTEKNAAPNSVDNPMESVVPPNGSTEGDALVVEKGVKIPKGQQKLSAIQDTIANAADAGKHVYITYQHPEWDEPKVYKVEPYSYRGDNNGKLMAYDTVGKSIKKFDTENIINATQSDHAYDPRWDVEIKPTSKATSPKDLAASKGLVYKGEVFPGSGVHQVEHPDYPNLTAAVKEPLTADNMKAAVDRKLEEFNPSSSSRKK